MQRLYDYYKKHLWFQVSLVFGIAILVITICYQKYLRKEYTDFLMEKNHMAESAVLETMEKNLDYSLSEYIDMGAQIAVDSDIYRLADKLFVKKEDIARHTRDFKMVFSTLASYSGNIVNMSLASSEGKVYQYDRPGRTEEMMWSQNDTDLLKVMYQQLYKKANSSTVPKYLVSNLPSQHPFTKERVFHVFYPMVGKNSSFTKMNAMLCITFRMDILQPLLDIASKDNSAYSIGYITDSFDTIIYHSNEKYIGNSEKAYLSKNSLISMTQPLRRLNWKLHIALDKNLMDRNVGSIIQKGMMVYMLLLTGLVVIFYLIIRKITDPLNKIGQAMAITGSGKKRKHVKIEGKHEIWQLAVVYNEMIDKIRIQEKETEESCHLSLVALERQHQAEREALETQINAHFLCNTLGTINYEAMEVGDFKVSLLIKKLSNILRYTFDQKCQQVYLYQEIAWIEQYLYLQKSRLEDTFDYFIDFPEGFSHCPCCKLMLQPFVENAILHGFEGREEGGILHISAVRQDAFLVLSIKDNGCGISEVKKEAIQDMLDGETDAVYENIGIGIRNVASRMRIFYGEHVKIKLNSQEGTGTEFLFMIPFSTDIEE